ncbi:hypothetical protein QR680_000438 [Steinernema hermaphroditum]|uniref:Uncharacterized protein n=1 Tax=Steinernema hermaphroditum TaxID=289476 RepID=A0AA39GUS8_9BILA|nr:hypothetical protein QR680_000438 [Steinernema hermaphroditum]
MLNTLSSDWWTTAGCDPPRPGGTIPSKQQVTQRISPKYSFARFLRAILRKSQRADQRFVAKRHIEVFENSCRDHILELEPASLMSISQTQTVSMPPGGSSQNPRLPFQDHRFIIKYRSGIIEADLLLPEELGRRTFRLASPPFPRSSLHHQIPFRHHRSRSAASDAQKNMDPAK